MPYPGRPILEPLPQFRGTASTRQATGQRGLPGYNTGVGRLDLARTSNVLGAQHAGDLGGAVIDAAASIQPRRVR